MSRSKNNGPDAFATYYGSMHGPRWPGLAMACKRPSRHFALQAGLSRTYFLDPASVLAALCLDISPGQTVLDLCAAPGGKSLVIAQRLFGLVKEPISLTGLGNLSQTGGTENDSDEALQEVQAPAPACAAPTCASDGLLVANELSANRRGRLRQVLSGCLPEECQSSLRTTAFDAAAWGQHEQDRYDRILLDIPCSSERHLIQDPAYLQDWSPRRSSQLAQQAYAMGLSAGRALKTGGILLYCTCALSDLENDDNVERIIERSLAQSGRFGYRLDPLGPLCLDTWVSELAAMTPAGQGIEVEATRFGQRIWPDRADGFGPLYFARLRKVAADPNP